MTNTKYKIFKTNNIPITYEAKTSSDNVIFSCYIDIKEQVKSKHDVK